MFRIQLLLTAFLLFGFNMGAHAIVLDFGDNAASSPGLYIMGYYNYYDAPRLKGSSGETIKTATDEHLNMSMHTFSLRPFIYFKGLNTLWVFNAVIPAGEVKARNLTTGRFEKSSGMGDILAGPAVFLYQHEKSGTFLSFWEFVSLPSGDYSKRRAREGGPNMGLNYWYLEHELCFATSFAEKSSWSYDMNINYFQKFSTSHLKPGDSLELEGILGYGVTDKIRIGAYGRYWKDMQRSRYFGADAYKTEYVSGGPSIAYSSGKWGVNVRWVYDFSADNGPKGNQIFLRGSFAF